MVKNGNKGLKIPKRSLTVHQVNKNLKTSGAVVKTMRRSVTIDPALHDYIIELRGWFGLEKHLDVDYTTVLNMLAKLGALRVLKWDDLTDREKTLMENTLESDPIQKREAAFDELWTKHLKVELPDYDPEPSDEELQDDEVEQNESVIGNSVKGKKKADIPEQE